MAQETVLIADDDTAIRTVLLRTFTNAGYEARATSNVATLWRWAQEGLGDLVITDVVMPDENIFNILPKIKAMRPDLPVIVISAENTIITAITAAEKGAYEYLPKPFDIKELLSVCQKALKQIKTEATDKPVETNDDLPLIGRSRAMQEIYRITARVMKTDLAVLIEGESGTGKELVAQALHNFSHRKNNPFVALNMAAIPKELIESELFGHEKGAFTGADSRHIGKFEQAEGGTLFLDEIGDMPLEAQTRLLRVLQEGEFIRIGGKGSIRTNVRIISATHRNLKNMIDQGQFREDLFYRLNVVPMTLPPLRNRKDDIPDLTHHFLSQSAEQTGHKKNISQDALKLMQTYHWPGNVRELENFIQRASVLCPEDQISKSYIETELLQNNQYNIIVPQKQDDLSQLFANYLDLYFSNFDGHKPQEGLHNYILRQIEPVLIKASLSVMKGNQIKTAELLGLNRNTLRKKIHEYQISLPPRQS